MFMNGVVWASHRHLLRISGRSLIGGRCQTGRTALYQRAYSIPRGNTRVLADFKQSPTHEIRDLEGAAEAGSQVVLHGYLGPQATLSKQLCFVPLIGRDLRHSVQIVSATSKASAEQITAHGDLLKLPAHTPVAVTGRVKARDAPPSEGFGDVTKIISKEIELLSIQALNEFPSDIIMTPDTVFPPEQRHLQLRQEKRLRDALQLRSDVAKACRDQLSRQGFVEVETPLLFKPTPEGAQEFIVPARRPGYSYALPQSPQQYKQILMSSGVSRYYQIARCFRDEDLRADRQPEFTQLDLELSFATGEDVMQCIEALVAELWTLYATQPLQSPFPRLTYLEAMQRFGSDKPDTRLGMEISRLDHLLPADLVSKLSGLTLPIIEGLRVPLSGADHSHGGTREFISRFLDSPEGETFIQNPDGAPGIFVYDSSKPLQGLQAFGFEAAEEIERVLEPADGDLLVLQARPQATFTGGTTMLGDLRTALHRAAVREGSLAHPTGFAPLWVTDFPLFSPSSESEPGQGGQAGLASTHHPFTSPKRPEDVDFLNTDPSSALADHYDLVINGVELGGGSRRIHNADMQRYIMEHVLQMSPARMEEFRHLLEALRAGCPPHAGMALGFDRLIAVLLGRESIREVMAFPKSNRGEDVLVRSPSPMTKDTLERYHLQTKGS